MIKNDEKVHYLEVESLCKLQRGIKPPKTVTITVLIAYTPLGS